MGFDGKIGESGDYQGVAETVVIGLGNPLRGDDGVGRRVVEALWDRALPEGVEVVDGGTEGLGLVSLLEGRRRAIVADAADLGRPPGEFVRFRWDEVRLGGDGIREHLSVHGAGLRDALRLAEALRLLPEAVVIFGVQPASLGWGQGLSQEVDSAVPEVVAAIMAELSGQTG